MTSLMLCKHKKTKPKLVAYAHTWNDGRNRKHGFNLVECCVYCGCVKRDKPVNKNMNMTEIYEGVKEAIENKKAAWQIGMQHQN